MSRHPFELVDLPVDVMVAEVLPAGPVVMHVGNGTRTAHAG